MDILDEGIVKKPELTKEEQLEARLLKIDIKQSFQKLKYGRTALFVIGVLFILGIILGLIQDKVDGIFVVIEGTIYSVLVFVAAVYLPKKPKLAMLGGTGVYFFNLLIATLLNPSSLISGIIFKGILIYFLLSGIVAAFTYQDAGEKLKKLGEEIPVESRFI